MPEGIPHTVKTIYIDDQPEKPKEESESEGIDALLGELAEPINYQ